MQWLDETDLELELENVPDMVDAALRKLDEINDISDHNDRVLAHPPSSTSVNTEASHCTASELEVGVTDSLTEKAPGAQRIGRKRRRTSGGRPRLTTHQRQKQEIESLREKVVQMEATLAELQGRSQLRRSESKSHVEVDQAWYAMALRQCFQRQQSESVNARLRRMLQAQATINGDVFQLFQDLNENEEEEETRFQIPPQDQRLLSGGEDIATNQLDVIDLLSDSELLEYQRVFANSMQQISDRAAYATQYSVPTTHYPFQHCN